MTYLWSSSRKMFSFVEMGSSIMENCFKHFMKQRVTLIWFLILTFYTHISYDVSVCLCTCMHLPRCTCESHRLICGNQFSPSTTWALGIPLKLAGFAAGVLPLMLFPVTHSAHLTLNSSFSCLHLPLGCWEAGICHY